MTASNSQPEAGGDNNEKLPLAAVIQFDDYEVTESDDTKLGEGTFGCVYRGRNCVTGEQVAVKKVANGQIRKAELELIQSLNSDFLIRMLDVCQMPNCTYLVMELCDLDLSEYLRSVCDAGKMRLANMRVLASSLAKGYGALYRERVVHRDIKPQNILLRFDKPHGSEEAPAIRTAKITDFGMSRVLSDDDASHSDADHAASSSNGLSNVAGTMYYMAPEVGANLVRPSEYDYQVDMWSIGCVLYECLSGELPFNERSLCQLFLLAAGENYMAYRMPPIPGDAPDVLAELVKALLNIDATKRLNPPAFSDYVHRWTAAD